MSMRGHKAKSSLKSYTGHTDNNTKLEDLKILRRSPDPLNNFKTGQGQLQLIMKDIWFYHNMGVAAILVSPVISEKKRSLDRYVVVQMSGLGLKVTGQLDIWYLYNTIVSLG